LAVANVVIPRARGRGSLRDQFGRANSLLLTQLNALKYRNFSRSGKPSGSLVRCAVSRPSYYRHMDLTRFETRLPIDQRKELEDLAERTGLSSVQLVRLAIRRLINDRDALLETLASER
jgi:predicted DNA-binding protein